MNLSKIAKIDRVMTAQAAGTTDVNSDVVDTQGFEGVLFIAAFGAITAGAVTSVKAQQGQQSDGSDMADLKDTNVTVADTDDDKVKYIDVYRPRERYVRCVVDRGTANAVIDGVIAILYGPRTEPVTHAAEVAGETHISPAEGTP